MSRLIFMFLLAAAVPIALIETSPNRRSPQSVSAAVSSAPPAVAPLMTTAGAAEQQVMIDNFAFEPRELQVAPGTRVTWINRDDVPHTATSSDSPAKFKSPALDTDDKFSYVFKQPGTYSYFCAVHPHMTGKIIVK